MARQSREGDVLAGKYRLEKLLGRGAVGFVYRAQNTLIGRTVAIKLLRPEHASDETLVARFLREARAANMVRHPNVVDVLDIGQDDDGVPFIVEEFLEGEDLAAYVRKQGGRLSAARALDILIPVAEAVGYAHSKGVVHRDLKPENVYLARIDERVVPKLLDFGLSRIKAGPSEIRMTATGITMGSPAYMSPEQIEGSKELDARADVWALGVMLYEVLSGSLPFTGESHVAVFMQIAWAEPTPLKDLAPNIPVDLTRVVTRCLRRAPAERYPTAAELARDMEHVREGSGIEPTMRLSVPAPPLFPGATGLPRIPRDRVPVFEHLEDSVVEPAQVRPARTRGAPTDHRMLEFSESAQSPGATASGLSIQTVRPPPQSRSEVNAKASESPPADLDTSTFWGATAIIATCSLTAGLLMIFLHRPGGWPVLSWGHGWLDGTATGPSLLVAALSLAAGISLGTRALQPPRRVGLMLTSAGLLLLTASLIARLAAIGSSVAIALASAWAVALIPAGLGISGMALAWHSWKGSYGTARLNAVVLSAASTIALFVAAEFVRAHF